HRYESLGYLIWTGWTCSIWSSPRFLWFKNKRRLYPTVSLTLSAESLDWLPIGTKLSISGHLTRSRIAFGDTVRSLSPRYRLHFVNPGLNGWRWRQRLLLLRRWSTCRCRGWRRMCT